MAVEYYACKHMGEDLYDLEGNQLACKFCQRIEYDRTRRFVNVVKKQMFSGPYQKDVVSAEKPDVITSMFTCPAKNFKLFEKAIEKGDVWKLP